MSAYWDVYCVDCKKELGLWGNHMVGPACDIAADAAKLASVPGLTIDASATYGFYGERGNMFSTDWFAEHAGHKIRAKNEYGDLSGTCGTTVDCDRCGSRGRCGGDPGHDGDHVPRRFY